MMRPYLERFTHRLTETESQNVLSSKHYADKLIIKPLRSRLFYMHHLTGTWNSYEQQTFNVQPTVAFLKHLRSYGEACEDLLTDDPFDQ